MTRVQIPTIGLALALILLAVGGAVAVDSANYNLVNDTFRGGNAGGQVSTSDSFILITNGGGFVGTSHTSANYDLCMGFVCDVEAPFYQLHLPALERN